MQYDDLVEVFTDKLVAKIPSTSNGVIKDIKYEVDDVCLVGHTLLTITVEGEEESETSGAAEIQFGQEEASSEQLKWTRECDTKEAINTNSIPNTSDASLKLE